jgi:hypothetical protein
LRVGIETLVLVLSPSPQTLLHLADSSSWGVANRFVIESGAADTNVIRSMRVEIGCAD